MGRVWPAFSPGPSVSEFAAVETDGPSENINLIEDGEAQIGFVTMGVAQQAWNGVGDWQGVEPRRNARAAFPMYDTPFHFIVPTDSPIQSMTALAGKRLGVGPLGEAVRPILRSCCERSVSRRLLFSARGRN